MVCKNDCENLPVVDRNHLKYHYYYPQPYKKPDVTSFLPRVGVDDSGQVMTVDVKSALDSSQVHVYAHASEKDLRVQVKAPRAAPKDVVPVNTSRAHDQCTVT